MLIKQMISIEKKINKTFNKKYFFIEGKINLDSSYFIEKIKKGILEKENLNYKTILRGQMTSYNFFLKDKEFVKLARYFVDIIDNNYNFTKYHLQDAWGFSLKKNEFTQKHTHHKSMWSGVVYLNDCSQNLEFYEINEYLKPEKGKFALFSSFLEHGTKPNSGDIKWGLSFNFNEDTEGLF